MKKIFKKDKASDFNSTNVTKSHNLLGLVFWPHTALVSSFVKQQNRMKSVVAKIGSVSEHGEKLAGPPLRPRTSISGWGPGQQILRAPM